MSPNDPLANTRGDLADEARDCMRPSRILLAEDDRELRRMLAEVLESRGYLVVQAEDGSSLLDQLAADLLEDEPQGFDLVISDIRMPGRSGLEVLERLRESDWQARFLLITAFGDYATHAEAYRLGGVVLDKPFQLSELLDRVGELVAPGG